jgi:hypothetical protein
VIGSGRWESKTYPGTKTLSASEYLTNKCVTPQREVVEGRTPQLSSALIASALGRKRGVQLCFDYASGSVSSSGSDGFLSSAHLFNDGADGFSVFHGGYQRSQPSARGGVLEVTRLRDSG